MQPGGKDELMPDALAFFGKVTAHVTHDIKNELAVMNEQSQLMQDILTLADKSGQINLERLNKLAQRLIARVAQTDRIIKRLNTFAHTADESLRTMDVSVTLKLMTGLATRPCMLKEITLEINEPKEMFSLTTNGFLMMEAWFACLEAAIKNLPQGGILTCGVKQGPKKEAEFYFKGPVPLKPIEGKGPAEKLLNAINATFGFKDGLCLLCAPQLPW